MNELQEMQKESEQVRRQIRECNRCELASRCSGGIPWRGPSLSRIVVVGEAPGRREDEQRKPFVGPAGQLAQSWIEPRFGDVAWLNTVSCFPNRTPLKAEVDACRTNLEDQLRVLQPEFALLFGGIAVSAWVDHRISEVRGRWIKICLRNPSMIVWGFPTWHPSAVLRNEGLLIDVLDDLRVFKESIGDDAIPPYVYRPCIKCGSVVDTHVTSEWIAWCGKHWAWKNGRAGKGKP